MTTATAIQLEEIWSFWVLLLGDYDLGLKLVKPPVNLLEMYTHLSCLLWTARSRMPDSYQPPFPSLFSQSPEAGRWDSSALLFPSAFKPATLLERFPKLLHPSLGEGLEREEMVVPSCDCLFLGCPLLSWEHPLEGKGLYRDP